MTVVITGRAVATSLGNDPDQLLDRLLAGHSGLGPFRHPDAAHLRTTLGFEVDDGLITSESLRASRWVSGLIRRALADADVDLSEPRRIAVVVGTGQRELNSVEQWATGRGPAIKGDELSYRRAALNAIGAVRFISVLGACAAGLLAVGIGADLLEDDESDLVVAVSVEPANSTVAAMYDRVATKMAEQVRPFDAQRVGTIFGEGAAAVVLERRGERNVRPKATLQGVGFSSDARRSTAPDTDGLLLAMTDAYARARVSGRDMDVVLAHGTGTARNDDAEAEALTRLQCTNAFVTSIKAAIGHTLASSGLISLIVAADCLGRGVVPPTLNLTENSLSAAELRIPRQSISDALMRYAQVDAFGFGGINAVAILERAS